jgi:hypothetical protein
MLNATKKFDKGGKPKDEKDKERHWNGQEDVDKLCMVFTNFLTDV